MSDAVTTEPPQRAAGPSALECLTRASRAATAWAALAGRTRDWDARLLAAEIVDLCQQAAELTAEAPDDRTAPDHGGTGLPVVHHYLGLAAAVLGSDRPGMDEIPARRLETQAEDLRGEVAALRARLSAQAAGFIGAAGAAPKGTLQSAPSSADPAQRYRDSADKLRGRVDTFAKALGSIGTTLATAAGISRLDGLLPSPSTALVVAAVFFFAMAITAIVGFAILLNGVTGTISMRSDPKDLATPELSAPEEKLALEVYRRTSDLNNAKSLFAYELRGFRLRRVRDWIGDADAAQACVDRAAEIAQDVDITLARAMVSVVRKRTTDVFKSTRAIILYAAFVGAIIGFAITTAKIAGDQNAATVAKACADAQTSLNNAVRTITVVSTTTRPTRTTVDGASTTIPAGTMTSVFPASASPLSGVPRSCKTG